MGKRDKHDKQSYVGQFASVNSNTNSVIETFKINILTTMEDMLNLFVTMIEQIEYRTLEGKTFREIVIDTLGYGSFSVKISQSEKMKLFMSGMTEATKFLQNPIKTTPIPYRQKYIPSYN